jgi:hypothetical protein
MTMAARFHSGWREIGFFAMIFQEIAMWVNSSSLHDVMSNTHATKAAPRSSE